MNKQSHIITELTAISSFWADKISDQPYRVPSGYFDQLAGTIMDAIVKQDLANELNEIAPLLAGMNREVPYSVPENYFEQVVPSVGQPDAKVVRFPQKPVVLKYAAAAAIIGLVFLAGWMFTNNSVSIDNTSLNLSADLSKVSEDALNTYLANHEVLTGSIDRSFLGNDNLPDVNTNIELLGDDELERYLDSNTLNTFENKTS